jgi:hypothetical protein
VSAKLDHVIFEAIRLCEFSRAAGKGSRQRQQRFWSQFKILRGVVANANLLPGEPIFCLRGKDRVAPDTVRFWRAKAQEAGALPETTGEAGAKYDAFLDWQQKNVRQVKVPT